MRINAHQLPAPQRAVVDQVLAANRALPRLDLAREHGRPVLEALEAAGHLVEMLSGALCLSPLTVKELAAYPPWSGSEDARLRALWPSGTPILEIAGTLGRPGGDVVQRAWALDLDRGRAAERDGFDDFVPAWRVRRLRLLLAEAERRGLDPRDDGEGLEHPALRRRFEAGRAQAPERGVLWERHCQRWSPAEVRQLEALREDGRTIATICRVLGRSPASVATKLTELGLSRLERWSLAEDEALAEAVAEGTANRAIAKRLGRSLSAVKMRANKLGLTGRRAFRPWSPEERRALCAVVREGRSVKEFAGWIGRSPSGCRWQCRIMGLQHPASTMTKQYTAAEDERIRAAWRGGEAPAAVAAELGRPLRSVYQRAFRLGVSGAGASYRRPVDESEIERLCQVVGAGGGVDDAARAIGRSRAATYKLASRFGIRFRQAENAPEAAA